MRQKSLISFADFRSSGITFIKLLRHSINVWEYSLEGMLFIRSAISVPLQLGFLNAMMKNNTAPNTQRSASGVSPFYGARKQASELPCETSPGAFVSAEMSRIKHLGFRSP